MENKCRKSFSFLFQHRQSAPEEGEKFYFRLVGGEHVVAHKWIIEEVTTTLKNELVILPTEGIGKHHVEVFVKFLYLEELDTEDPRMSIQDMQMIVRLCQLLNLKEDLRKKLHECIQPAMSKRLEEDLIGTASASGSSHSQETDSNDGNNGATIAEENRNGDLFNRNEDVQGNNNGTAKNIIMAMASSNDQTTSNIVEGGGGRPTEPTPGSTALSASQQQAPTRIQNDCQHHRKQKEPKTCTSNSRSEGEGNVDHPVNEDEDPLFIPQGGDHVDCETEYLSGSGTSCRDILEPKTASPSRQEAANHSNQMQNHLKRKEPLCGGDTENWQESNKPEKSFRKRIKTREFSLKEIIANAAEGGDPIKLDEKTFFGRQTGNSQAKYHYRGLRAKHYTDRVETKCW